MSIPSFEFFIHPEGCVQCTLTFPGEGLDFWGKISETQKHLDEHGNFRDWPTEDESEKRLFSEVDNFIAGREIVPGSMFDSRDPFGFGFRFFIK